MTTTMMFQTKPVSQISPEQDVHRKEEAHDMLMKLQTVLMEGSTPAMDILSETLQKVEDLLTHTSRQEDMDMDTRKALEDISALMLSARQLARNKDIAERLLKISEESQKAIDAQSRAGVTAATKEMTKDVMDFMNTWRPLFYLLLSSRDFRVLLLDTIHITRRVVYSYTDNLSDETTQKFIEGEKAENIAENIKEKVKIMGTPELSNEEWDIIQDDLQRVLILLSREPEYRLGMERIFNLLDMFQNSLLKEETTTTTAVLEELHVRKVVLETEELVSSFSGRETLEQFKFHLKKLIRKSKEHQPFHAYLNELKEFILKSRTEEEVRSEEFKAMSKEMAHRGRELIRELKEDDDLKPFLRSANMMLDNIKNDEFLQLLRHHAGIVQADLSYVDNEGKLQLDTDMLTKLQTVLLPVLVDALKYIPVPRIQSSDRNRTFWLDKIVLCSYDIIPENIRFHLETNSEFSFQDIQIRETHTFLVIQLNQLRTELKDVEFFYKKKTFPELEDSGRVTFRIKGDGARLTLTYKVSQNPEEQVPQIMEGQAHFDISDLDIEFDTNTIKHTVLVPMLTSIFKIQIKNQIEEEVERNLKNWINKLGDVMSSSIGQLNRPLLSGLEAARKTLKSTQMAQLVQKRREKLE